MKKFIKTSTYFFILLLVLIITFYSYKNISGRAVQEGKYDKFAKYLTEKGIKMYGTEWCPHCKNQKKLFGSSFKYIDYIDCDKNMQECLSEGIQGYPTWKINGENYPGIQTIKKLAELSGYQEELK